MIWVNILRRTCLPLAYLLLTRVTVVAMVAFSDVIISLNPQSVTCEAFSRSKRAHLLEVAGAAMVTVVALLASVVVNFSSLHRTAARSA